MGLHVCYELALPDDTTHGRVLELLRSVHRNASQLGFARVTEIREFHGDECEYQPENESPSLWSLFKIAALKRVVVSEDADRDAPVRPEYAVGFLVLPGRRSEPAAFGFSHGPPGAVVNDEKLPVRHPGWHWHYCCKTQYASVISDEHFLGCHLGLIDLLDSSAALGIHVTVRDEAGYFEHRDVRRLLERVHAENQVIARIAGRLAEALDSESTRTQSPIFQHPRFEHLEGEG